MLDTPKEKYPRKSVLPGETTSGMPKETKVRWKKIFDYDLSQNQPLFLDKGECKKPLKVPKPPIKGMVVLMSARSRLAAN